jgi:hypothetical protein
MLFQYPLCYLYQRDKRLIIVAGSVFEFFVPFYFLYLLFLNFFACSFEIPAFSIILKKVPSADTLSHQ